LAGKVVCKMELIVTLVIGMIGGLVALKLKVPAGAMVGSMLSVALYNIITGEAYFPQDLRVITQIAAGAFIGAGITKKDVLDLKLMIKPAILMVSTMIILDLFLGYIMFKITNIDLVTSLFACAPGGLVDMSLISADLGADSSKVALLQMVRLMSVLIILPPIIRHIASSNSGGTNKAKKMGLKEDINHDSSRTNKVSDNEYTKKEEYINLTITLIIASITGLIGYKLKIPAGAMTASMIAVGALNIFYNKGYMPINIRRVTQVFAGALIGQKMGYGDLIALKSIILPVFILIIGIIVVNFFIGVFIHRVAKLELATSLLASAPGGMSDMALVAKDLGGDAPKVAVLQLARYICIVAFYPVIIKLISSI
jgi:membrane AbrB-like protein